MTADTRPVHSGSRRPCRRTLLLFLCLLTTLSALLSTGVLTAAAEDPPASTDVGVVLLLNLENNLTLYEKEADTNALFSGLIIVFVATVMLILNLILDTAFFGLSLRGKHNIYNNVLVDDSYLSALLYYIGLCGVLTLGYGFNRILNRRPTEKMQKSKHPAR